ncbi:MAG: peptidase dimerization domain-containing protein, partial [Acidimicrobiales bacterium]
GSRPFRSDNALIRASEVVRRLSDYRPAAQLDDLWKQRVETMRLDPDLKAALLDPERVWDACQGLPAANAAALFHACTHTTFSPNMMAGGQKVNIIPDRVEITVDIRTVPGDGPDQVDAHLAHLLGDLAESVTITTLAGSLASRSPHDTELWTAMQDAVNDHFPGTPIIPQMIVGFTDARIFREHGTIAYGAGLMSPSLSGADFGSRFHGNNERIDTESLQLSASFWEGVIRRFQT